MAGVKFRRQHPIGPCFADFAYVSHRLVVEIDGDHHAFQVEADARRTSVLVQEGWRVVRFAANEAVSNPEGVWVEIERLLRGRSRPNSPSPRLRAGPLPLPPLRGRRGPFKKYNVVMLKVVMPVGGSRWRDGLPRGCSRGLSFSQQE
jgi:hypothetical protein